MTNVGKMERLARSVPGNSPIGTKEHVGRLMDMFTSCGFGTRASQCLNLVEIAIVPSAHEPTKDEAKVILETTVNKDMVNPNGTIRGGCIAHFVDICSTLAIVVMSLAKGGRGSPGVSLNINAVYHAPANLGDKLRLVNTSTAVGTRLWNARTEIWDVAHHRLVASATHIKMEASAPKL